MYFTDVNILVSAFREDSSHYSLVRPWFEAMIDADDSFGMSDVVLSSFLRIVTNPRIFRPAAPLDHALGFVAALRDRPNYVEIKPGPRHWDIFTTLCRAVDARGNIVPDAYLAALAIEAGCEWVTTDTDFARFPGLRWRNLLAG